VVCGEVGLAGEVRQVGHISHRITEAARLGFTRAIVPGNSPDTSSGIKLQKVTTLSEALAAVGLAHESA